MRPCSLLLTLVAGFAATSATALTARDYDIVYVRQVRFGDNQNTIWPEAGK